MSFVDLKIISVVGARPQFVKLASLSKTLRCHCEEVIVHTGQHYDYNMSKCLFEQLGIPDPDYDLEIGSGTHAYQTGHALIHLEKVYLHEQPDMVIVFGDTNATVAGCLTAAKMSIPVAHVESGLRSFNREMPEEINRIITDHCSSLLFAPTDSAMDNLRLEGLCDRSSLTGDVMMDSLQTNIEIAEARSSVMDSLGLEGQEYLLLTLHRPYNVDHEEALRAILDGFAGSELPVIFPIHPRTRRRLRDLQLSPDGRLRFVDPLSYLDFLWLQKNAFKIITDSGGVQKEAYMLGVPCLTVRPETEWVETLLNGWNVLVTPKTLPEEIAKPCPKAEQPAIFGEGNSAKLMVKHIVDFLDRR